MYTMMSNVPYYKASYLLCHTQRLIAAEMNPVFLLNTSTGIKTLLRPLFPLSITSHQYLSSAASGMAAERGPAPSPAAAEPKQPPWPLSPEVKAGDIIINLPKVSLFTGRH